MNEEQKKIAIECELDGIQGLLESGLDVNSKDQNGNTMLMFAAQFGKNEVVNYLIGKGADVDIKDKNNKTALVRAALKGHISTMEILIENKAVFNDLPPRIMFELAMNLEITKSPENSKNLVKIARVLLEHGADADYRNEEGGSPLVHCARHSLYALAELLIEFGASTDIIYCGMDIFTHASNQRDYKMVELLKRTK